MLFYLQQQLSSSSGFRLNASSWPMFLLKTLNGAEMAPSRIFHKVPVKGSWALHSLKNKLHEENEHVYLVAILSH